MLTQAYVSPKLEHLWQDLVLLVTYFGFVKDIINEPCKRKQQKKKKKEKEKKVIKLWIVFYPGP